MNEKQEFLEILENPTRFYMRKGLKQFKQILLDRQFNYEAKYGPVNNVLFITVETDDQDALDDLDKDFTLCFSQTMQHVWIKNRQHGDSFSRRYILHKTRD